MIHPINHGAARPPSPASSLPSCLPPRSALGGAAVARLVCALIILAALPSPAIALCPKSHVLETMLTKVCWGCVFPFRLGGKTLISKGFPADPAAPTSTFCHCDDKILPGVTVGFSEPIRLIEVVKEPYCFPALEGVEMKKDTYERSGEYTEAQNGDTKQAAFYNVHYIGIPLWEILGLTASFVGSSISNISSGFFPDLSKCFSTGGYDVSNYSLLYLSELDPTWNDDEIGALLNPEAILFGNPMTQALCAGDCVAASAGWPIDPLFWCAGCWGSMYPYTGTVAGPVGEANTAALLAARTLAKMNRGVLRGIDVHRPRPVRQGLYGHDSEEPVPAPTAVSAAEYLDPSCAALRSVGTPLLWGSGKAYPVYGEDFSFLVWRQRDCCAR